MKCEQKRKFKSGIEALDFNRAQRRKYPNERKQNHYRCPQCGWWHLATVGGRKKVKPTPTVAVLRRRLSRAERKMRTAVEQYKAEQAAVLRLLGINSICRM